MVFEQDLRIDGYKHFRGFVLPKPGRVNLITGKNNVGKTALLEALYLGCAKQIDWAVVDIMQQRRESGVPSVGSWVRAWFTDARGFAIGSNRVGVDEFGNLRRASAGGIDLDGLRAHAEERLDPVAAKREGCLAIWQSGVSERELDSFWDELQLRGDLDQLVGLMRIVAPEIVRVGLKGDGREVRQPYYADADGTQYPLNRLGQGMKRLLGLAFGLYFCRNGVLLVDEIETGLHYSIQDEVWGWIFGMAAKLDVQVFATTHSKDATKAFARAAYGREEGEGVITRLEMVRGKLEAVAYNKEEAKISAEVGMEVR